MIDTSRAAMASALGSARSERSGLVVDVDRETARAVLFSLVEGRTRFVSSVSLPSTALPPIDDASVGAKQAVRAIEEHTGVELLGADGIEIPSSNDIGVDVFAVTGIPGAPVRVSIVSVGATPLESVLVAAGRRTLSEVDILTDRVRTGDGALSGSLLEAAIRGFMPDALVLAQGAAKEAEWKAAVGTLSGLVADDVVSIIIVVAGAEHQQQAAQMIGESADLRGIDPAEFSPVDIAAALEAELQSLFEKGARALNLVPATVPPAFVSRARAGDLVTRFVARRLDETIVAVDVSDGTMFHWATPSISDVIVRLDVDVTRNVRSALDIDPARITRWLPMTVSNEDLSHWVLNRALRPRTRADAPHDMAIERAILVELLRTVWQESSGTPGEQIDLLIAGRPFSRMESPGLAALSLLDIFDPDPASGLVEMVLDVDGLLFAAGAVGEASPAIAADIVENDLLARFATAVIVKGGGNEGEIVVRGQARYAGGETERIAVPAGSVHLVKLNPRKTATISLVCEGDATIGGRSELMDLVVGGDDNVDAGEFGLLVDARGRPAPPSGDAATRSARVATWLADLGFRIS
ncbi:MAG TPA: hypothetical protein VMM78_09700 [Thermomicrobiales bacterium]|nr:hypothetical protein [Thermomicrobiales bacterium]